VKLKELKRNQKGFTLIELLVAIALTAIVGLAATIAIHQIVTGTALSNNKITAINQVRTAAYWINRDVEMTQKIVCNNNTTSPEFISLKWQVCEPYGGATCTWTQHTINYTLTPMPGKPGFKELWRTYDGGNTTLISQYIEPKNEGVTWCSWNATEKMLSVNITATMNDQTETRMFQVKPRPTG
jgi:prepilin-type N-terminal cleavage/methylation domain-containing protein